MKNLLKCLLGLSAVFSSFVALAQERGLFSAQNGPVAASLAIEHVYGRGVFELAYTGKLFQCPSLENYSTPEPVNAYITIVDNHLNIKVFVYRLDAECPKPWEPDVTPRMAVKSYESGVGENKEFWSLLRKAFVTQQSSNKVLEVAFESRGVWDSGLDRNYRLEFSGTPLSKFAPQTLAPDRTSFSYTHRPMSSWIHFDEKTGQGNFSLSYSGYLYKCSQSYEPAKVNVHLIFHFRDETKILVRSMNGLCTSPWAYNAPTMTQWSSSEGDEQNAEFWQMVRKAVFKSPGEPVTLEVAFESNGQWESDYGKNFLLIGN